MGSKWFVIIFLVVFSLSSMAAKQQTLRLMSYNVENLFDTQEDYPRWDDREFTPDGRRLWTEQVLRDKCRNLAKIIIDNGADVVGLTEVEGGGAAIEYLMDAGLYSNGYKFFHVGRTDDRRGITNAVISKFPINDVVSHNVWRVVDSIDLKGTLGGYPTRDILEVSIDTSATYESSGKFIVLVNHWPSRIRDSSADRRLIIAKEMQNITDDIVQNHRQATVVAMGDFNDDVWDASINQGLKKVREIENLERASAGTYYPLAYEMTGRSARERGTYKYRKDWYALDHFFVAASRNVSQRTVKGFHYKKKSFYIAANEFAEKDGSPRGCQKREDEKRCLNGASDHLPIVSDFEYR